MQTQHFIALHQPGNRPKGKVNMHCSRHALIGLFGHCPEAKTYFTVSNHDPIQQTTIRQSKIPCSKL